MARKKAKALPPKTITVYAEILQETELAILVRCDEEADGVWLPKSQIKYSGERGDCGVEIEIPELLADEKGFFDGMGKPEPAAVSAESAGTEKGCETCKYSNAEGFATDDSVACTNCLEFPDFSGWEPKNDAPADEAPEDSPARRNFGDNVKWLREERITVSAPLSEAEKARYADEMAALDGEIEALKDERAEVSNRLKKQIDAKEEERLALSRAVNDGETREILCDCLKDYNTGEMVWTDAFPPYAEVLRRKMTEEEKQPTLLEYQEKNGQTPPPADEGEGEGVDFDAMTGQPGETAAGSSMDDGANEPPAEPEANPQEAA